MINFFRLPGIILQKIKFKKCKFLSKGHNVEWHNGTISDPQNISIGSHIYFGPGASIHGRGGISIADGVIFGPRVTIHSSNHNYESEQSAPYDGGVSLRPVVIEEGVWVGDSAMICPGVRVGRGAVIAMGSVVTRDVPGHSVVGGNPAKVIKRRNNPERTEELIVKGEFYLKLKKQSKIKYFDMPRASDGSARGRS
ncbi:DapH/DapD/GlmU-related protein [Massilia cellulosiltytica]|uniref:acyltransferase n=1 Tax=Massilia TaxID=149698 RepID=UPI00138EE148|nr:acyltransferase [Massilia sp. Root1485]